MLMFGTLHWQMERVCHPNCGSWTCLNTSKNCSILPCPSSSLLSWSTNITSTNFQRREVSLSKVLLDTKGMHCLQRIDDEHAGFIRNVQPLRNDEIMNELCWKGLSFTAVVSFCLHHTIHSDFGTAAPAYVHVAKAFAKGFCELARTKVLFPQISIWPGYLRGSNKTGFGQC